MSGPRRPLVLERIVATINIDDRVALVFEQLASGKILIWRCSRSPAGHPALASSDRVFSIPFAALGQVAAVLQRLGDSAMCASEIRRSA